MAREFRSIDGNYAATYVAYAFSDVAAIYPITPSSAMGEYADTMSANGVLNLFGQRLKVVEMQSEAGAAGAVHGVLSAGALATTFTASQGLLLMVPNMFKISGELSPTVFHVSARSVATHALSIFGDHSDVMAARSTGFGFMAAASCQEVHDLGIVSHIATLKTRVPMVNFFDGFRTSHEIQKVEVMTYDEMAEMMPWDDVTNFRQRGMNPEHPQLRGTAQNPDIFFQAREAANTYYDRAAGVIQETMEMVSAKLGRTYNLFDYHGDPDAEHVIITMTTSADVAHETIDYLNARGGKYGLIKVRLYRPWSTEHLMKALPQSTKRIAVLDRTKEPGALGEPLYVDVIAALNESQCSHIEVCGGRYGLSSKDFTPSQVKAVFENLEKDSWMKHFTVGINDDVTNLSLEIKEELDTTPEGTVSCKFWGLGSDGTVGANKEAIKIIGDHTDKYTQGYFAYDSKKSGGITISHLRFSDNPLRGHYFIKHADYVACHNSAYVGVYDMLADLKQNGTFVLNCLWEDMETLNENLPGSIKRVLAEKNAKFYTINAVKIAEKIGLGNRINMIMQTAFFTLSKVLPVDEAIDYLKKAIDKTYGKKGKNIVEMNWKAVDATGDAIREIEIPADWANAEVEELVFENDTEWVKNVMRPILLQKGDSVPVSAFTGELDGNYSWTGADGTFPVDTTQYEKRGIAINVPEWNPDSCILCNQCSFVCPHAAIRPICMNEEEAAKAPDTFKTKDGKGKLAGLKCRIQVYVDDCTGCGNCADICPVNVKGKDDPALTMVPHDTQLETEVPNYKFAGTVSAKDDIMPPTNVIGSQLQEPLFEFSGACAGCGETPYYKLLTQLFGDRLIIGNATGCSSIYGGSAPSCPFAVNKDGHGPAWANSLFEDNAEYAFGMKLAHDQRRDRIAVLINEVLTDGKISGELKGAMEAWLEGMHDADKSKAAGREMAALLEKEAGSDEKLRLILSMKDMFTKKSIWACGGDGWAYDIGYGGLDHVMAMNMDVNILVMDTEVYSNTGGQSSKATPTGSVAKFAASGKKTAKKDLGAMLMTYGYVYVASIAMGADKMQTLRAFREAEAYPGPSIIIAYSPCINHGIKAGMGKSQEEENLAVKCGYWPLYRYNPLLALEGKNPFVLDSKEPTGDLHKFLMGEVRYATLTQSFPEEAEKLHTRLVKEFEERYQTYKRQAESDFCVALAGAESE